jgi:hypothetical protein
MSIIQSITVVHMIKMLNVRVEHESYSFAQVALLFWQFSQ